MHGEPKTFWAKIRRAPSIEGGCEWHPLVDHCADVGVVAETLLHLPVWQRRLTRLARRDLCETTWARLSVLAALHDVGKLNIGFQAKGRPELGATCGHVEETVPAIFRSDVFSCLAELSNWGDAAATLLVTAICHHGRPHDANAPGRWQATWWASRMGLDPRAGATDLLQRCRAWFPRAFLSADSLPDAPEFSHAFAGLVMLADWIASDETFFPFGESAEDRMSRSRERAHDALAGIGLAFPLSARSDRERREPFARVAPSGYQARAAQRSIGDLPDDERGSITILEAETGSGKTEAALVRFVKLFEAGLVDGLYFALPTRSAATEIHRRIHSAVRQAFEAPPGVVLAVPGYLRVDEAEGAKQLARFEVLWPDTERFRHRAWAAENSKRYMAGAIVIGTIDQVLLSSLMVGHAHLRATALLRHLLVVDEVHASDAYMQRILREVLAHHFSAGGHALLLSATLGAETRVALLHPHESPDLPELKDALAAPYPLITHRSAVISHATIPHEGNLRQIALRAEPWLESPDALAAEALSAAAAGAKVLVIRNTVKDCIDTQLAAERLAIATNRRDMLFGVAGIPAPHHSRFARPDRTALDRALESHIGKGRSEGGCLVVATQTVQQSLDLDADILFSDLCPADVLLQRCGRLHRHPAHNRPPGFAEPLVVVAVPLHRDLGLLLGETGVARNYHGLGSVYPDLRMLEATWRLVEGSPKWIVPAMNRALVEQGLHSEALAAIVSGAGPKWAAHAARMIGVVRGQARQADLNLVDWTRPYATMSFPNSLDQRILTRLGEGDRLVSFAPPFTGPFGFAITELVLRADWCRGMPSELDPVEDFAASNGAMRFALLGSPFIYDRLGLRPATTSSMEGEDAP